MKNKIISVLLLVVFAVATIIPNGNTLATTQFSAYMDEDEDCEYTGKNVRPFIVASVPEKVFFTKHSEEEDVDLYYDDNDYIVLDENEYSVKYPKSSKKVGVYKAEVKLSNIYGDSKVKYVKYKVLPKATKIKKLTVDKNTISVKWTKISKETSGYQIMYATNKAFTKNAKTIKVKSNLITSKKISNLASRKQYYVRIRTYKKVGKKTYYSEWSDVKGIKTKSKTVAQATTPVVTPQTPTVTKDNTSGDYVLNKNTHKFHYPSCGSVKQMSAKNRWYYTGTRDQIIGMGYSPCNNCKP